MSELLLAAEPLLLALLLALQGLFSYAQVGKRVDLVRLKSNWNQMVLREGSLQRIRLQEAFCVVAYSWAGHVGSSQERLFG